MSEETLACVYRHGAGLAITHAISLKNVPSVLTLVKEEVVRSLLQ
jgi:hypothetical protein